MIKEIIRDPVFLGRKSADASSDDVITADDLADTLRANSERCVGMAANMIGVSKRIIVFADGKNVTEMFNPEIVSYSGPYEAEEGCLSLEGVRKTKRYNKIKVRWQTRDFKWREKSFSDFTAQIIQHEIDHTKGILI